MISFDQPCVGPARSSCQGPHPAHENSIGKKGWFEHTDGGEILHQAGYLFVII